MQDQFQRNINYMRISITDRCNLRCCYCMPEGLKNKLPMTALLQYEELLEIAEAAVSLGITRFKVTGGEPLVRRHCEDFIRNLKQLPGVEQVTLTTNGILLEEKLAALREAGIDGINISLDTLDPKKFEEITGFPEFPMVWRGLEKALTCGIPVKINAVLQRGMNDSEWRGLAELARTHPLDVRFIEMMPIGHGKDFSVVGNDEIQKKLEDCFGALRPDGKKHGNGPASYFKPDGFQGSIGFISAIHGKFCGGCNRIRLSSVGKLKPCLCFGDTVDLMPILRGWERSEIERTEAIKNAIGEAIRKKPEAHHFETASEITEQKEMVSIGG